MSDLQEATKEFLIESHESLDQLDSTLVKLEAAIETSDGTSIGPDGVDRIFRVMHTLKGSCSFLGFQRLESLAHAAEELLSRMRDGTALVQSTVIRLLFDVTDTIRKVLEEIEQTGTDGDEDHHELIARLNTAGSNKDSPKRPAPTQAYERPSSVVIEPQTSSYQIDLPRSESLHGDTTSVVESSVRIDTGILDRLMTIAGEIVLARNQLLQHCGRHQDPALQNACRDLNLITSELQEQVMRTRLQPIGSVWHRFPRFVHDAAADFGKQVRLLTEGAETELDRGMIEAVRDPLAHLLRNSIDHGIEKPEVRQKAGKSAIGTIRLRAYHEGGLVNIEISDDGAGIDPERVKRRAIEQGILTVESAGKLESAGEGGLIMLIFAPGFSTAEEVSMLSGRGVGLDVVRENLERIGGTVEVHSEPKRGTTVRMRIPLTLAILKALLVVCENDLFAVPQASVIELVLMDAAKWSRVETIPTGQGQGAMVYRYRDELLPLVHLSEVLQLDNENRQLSSSGDNPNFLIVLQAGDRQFGVVVDGVIDTQEIVVKPLWKRLKGLSCFAGATILGDGQVSLILDVFGLAGRVHIVPRLRDRSSSQVGMLAEILDQPVGHAVLLASIGEGAREVRLAVPLAQVERLEEFPLHRIEWAGDRPVIQFAGEILPVTDLTGRLLNGIVEDAQTSCLAIGVICSHEGPSGDPIRQGLLVDSVIDIVIDRLERKGPAHRPESVGTTIINGRVTEILDVGRFVGAIHG